VKSKIGGIKGGIWVREWGGGEGGVGEWGAGVKGDGVGNRRVERTT
jgi:hypothetical protein